MFKAGDKVRLKTDYKVRDCVIKKDDIYTVKKWYGNVISLEEIVGGWWANAFEPVAEMKNWPDSEGDWIRDGVRYYAVETTHPRKIEVRHIIKGLKVEPHLDEKEGNWIKAISPPVFPMAIQKRTLKDVLVELESLLAGDRAIYLAKEALKLAEKNDG